MCEADVAGVCAITVKTVQRIRKRAVEEGLDIAIESKFNQRQRPAPKLDGEQHAHLVTLASSTPPEGRIRWTMELLADKLVELKIVDSISDTTVWRELKKRTAEDWAWQIKQRVLMSIFQTLTAFVWLWITSILMHRLHSIKPLS